VAWKPTTARGRFGAWAALFSIVCLAVYASLLSAGVAGGWETTAIRVGLPLLLVATVSGVAATGAMVAAVFRSGDRSRVAVGVLGFSLLMFALLVVFIVADIAGGAHGRDLTVSATFAGGRPLVQSEYRKSAHGAASVTFDVTNTGSAPIRVGIMELKTVDASGNAAPPFLANTFPLIDSQVRWFTFHDEAQVVFWTSGEPIRISVPRGSSAPPRPEGISREVAPGTTMHIQPSQTIFEPATVFVVFRDGPGEYAASLWTVIQVEP
jgi:hypothetical protein